MSTIVAPAVEKKLLTAEEFFLLPDSPDGGKQELVRGEVIIVAQPGFRHGKKQFRIARVIDDFITPRRLGQVVTECGVITERGPDTVRGPDVSYWSAERLPLDQEPVGYPDLPADLVVEVLPPSNRPGQMRKKVAEYFQAGVRMVWLVDPEDRMCWVYRSTDEARVLHENATLDGSDVLPEFTCRVADLFG